LFKGCFYSEHARLFMQHVKMLHYNGFNHEILSCNIAILPYPIRAVLSKNANKINNH
jgi:hypothetical protein